MTNASGLNAVSGRKSIDGGALSLLSGWISGVVEVTPGQGVYMAPLYDFDTNGRNIGFNFTASGCVPVNFTIITTNNVSGQIFLGSGSLTSGMIASGTVFIASGPFVNATATVSSGQVFLASGSFLFGSGQFFLGSGSITSGLIASGIVFIASGAFVNATAVVNSGALYLASGSIFNYTFASGVIGGGSGNLPSAWGGSGQVLVASGTVNLASGSITSGLIASGTVFIASGPFVVATASVASGSLYLASGSIFKETFAGSGILGASGAIATAWGNSGAVTVGQNLDKTGYTVLSGTTFIASGPFVVATATVGSGSLYLASGSIFMNTFASGVVGGGSGNLPSSWGASGVVAANVISSVGVAVFNSDGTLASAAATTVTFATTDSAGNSIPDDNRYAYTVIQIVSGTGLGQVVLLTAKNGTRTFNILSGTCPVQLDNTSQYIIVGSWRSEVETWVGSVPNSLAQGRVDSAFNLRTGTARSGTSNTIQLDAGTVLGISGVYDNNLISLVGGTGSGRTRLIANAGSSGILTVYPAWDASGVPDATSIFTIIPGGVTNLSSGTMNSGQSPVPLSGQTYIASGPFVNATATVTSGQVYLASGSIPSGTVFIASGPFVVATATVGSGSLYLASGSIFVNTFASGVLGSSGAIATAWGSSGAVTVGQNLDKTGYSVTSGTTFIASGPFVTATATVASGQTYLASGSFLFGSGTFFLGSGSITNTTILSGTLFIASGCNAVVPPASISGVNSIPQSGVFVASGPFVVANATIASGSVYLASGSVFRNTFASGLLGASGGIATAWGNSGSVVTALNQDKSGYAVATNLDKSGYTLSSSGLDTIIVELGMNMRQAQSVMAAALGGRLSGAGMTTIKIDGANASGTSRISASVDSSGNRTNVVLNLPT